MLGWCHNKGGLMQAGVITRVGLRWAGMIRVGWCLAGVITRAGLCLANVITRMGAVQGWCHNKGRVVQG